VCDCYFNPQHPIDVRTVTYYDYYQSPSCTVQYEADLDPDCYYSRLAQYLYPPSHEYSDRYAWVCVTNGTAFCYEKCDKFMYHFQSLRVGTLGPVIGALWTLVAGVPLVYQYVRRKESRFYNKYCGYSCVYGEDELEKTKHESGKTKLLDAEKNQNPGSTTIKGTNLEEDPILTAN